MKIGIIVLLSVVAAGPLLFPVASAAGTTYADPDERRSSMLGTLILLSALVGGFGILCAFMKRISSAELEIESSSVVVPPVEQESNIVQPIINT